MEGLAASFPGTISFGLFWRLQEARDLLRKEVIFYLEVYLYRIVDFSEGMVVWQDYNAIDEKT